MSKSPRTISMDDDLWDEVVQAAAKEAVKQGKQVSVSAWIRQAMRERLEREG